MMGKLSLGFVLLFGSLYRHASVVLRSPSSFKGGLAGDESFTKKMLDRHRQNDTSTIIMEGYVTSKRSIGRKLAFIDFQVDDHDNNDDNKCEYKDENHNLCQALLRKDVYQGRYYEGYRRCLLKGCKFRIEGTVAPTKIPGNVVLMVNSMELLALPHQAQHIQIILQQAKDGAIPFEDVMRAHCYQNNHGKSSPSLELEKRVLSLNPYPIDPSSIDDDDGLLKRLAKDILSTLPDDPQYPISADQKHLSKNGNFVLLPVPSELQTVPERLQTEIATEMITPQMIQSKEKRVNEVLKPIKCDEKIHTALERVCIVGWVQNRRRFEGNVTMIYLQDDLNPNELDRLPCLVHPSVLLQQQQQTENNAGRNCLKTGLKNDAGVYQNLIAPGSKVRIEGRLLLSENRNETNLDSGKRKQSVSPLLFWVENIRLVRCSFRSVTIRHLLDLLYEERMDPKEVSEALAIPYEDVSRLASQSDATERQWKANQLAVQLQDASNNEKSRKNMIDSALLQVMEKYRFLSRFHPVISTDIIEKVSKEDDDNDNDNEKTDQVSSFLQNKSIQNNGKSILTSKRRKVSFGMPGSKWQIKKKPQLEWMGRQIRSVLESHPDFKKRVLTVIDIGGGKGALANYLGRDDYLSKYVQVHVIDICKAAVLNGEKKAKRFDLPIDFQFADASNSNLLDAVKGDVVVALHACGHLSDVALAHAIHRRAGFVIVPCCFNSNPHLMIPVSDGGGSSSNGNTTTVPDWLGLPSSDWSALKMLCEVQDDIPLASEAIGILCAVRAEAAKKKISLLSKSKENNEASIDGNNPDPSEQQIQIRSFPIQYSTRNTVLVGMCS